MTAARSLYAGALLGLALSYPSSPAEVFHPVAAFMAGAIALAEGLGAVFGGRKA